MHAHASSLIAEGTAYPAVNRSCLVIASSVTNLPRLYRFLERLEVQWKIPSDILTDIHMALTEAVNNAILHGNMPAHGRFVCIKANREYDSYSFSVEDEGKGFDPGLIIDPTLPERIERPGGRGIFLMKHLADDLHFSQKGKCIHLLFLKRKKTA